MKYTKTEQLKFIESVRANLRDIAMSDGIDVIDTFDRKLAEQLRTVQGAATNALTYMSKRGL